MISLVALELLASCGDTRPARQPEGSVAFRSGTGRDSSQPPYVITGPVFQRPGLLIPANEQVWQAAWIDQDHEQPLLDGARAGMATGIGILMMAPEALVFWPAAVGIVVGSTAMGMLGVTFADSTNMRLSAPDQAVIAEATKSLQPDRLFRESMEQRLSARARNPLAVVTWYQPVGPDTAGTDPLAAARAQQLDGIVECTLDAIGLAAGEERDTFGVFVQVRVRALDARDGQLRYERVLSYGPGQAVAGLPNSEFHTVEFLAADQGRVYRQVASDAIRRLARVLGEDPQLPLTP